MKDLVTRFFDNASKLSDHLAVVEDCRQITYGELGVLVKKIAAEIEKYGAQPRVIIYLHQGYDAYAAMIATLLAGGYYTPINMKAPLQRHLDVFSRIVECGYIGTVSLLEKGGDIVGEKQQEADATYCKRRKAEQSEITLKELTEESTEYLYNKIRMLEDPYPNAFIRTKDNKKLFIKMAEIA